MPHETRRQQQRRRRPQLRCAKQRSRGRRALTCPTQPPRPRGTQPRCQLPPPVNLEVLKQAAGTGQEHAVNGLATPTQHPEQHMPRKQRTSSATPPPASPAVFPDTSPDSTVTWASDAHMPPPWLQAAFIDTLLAMTRASHSRSRNAPPPSRSAVLCTTWQPDTTATVLRPRSRPPPRTAALWATVTRVAFR